MSSGTRKKFTSMPRPAATLAMMPHFCSRRNLSRFGMVCEWHTQMSRSDLLFCPIEPVLPMEWTDRMSLLPGSAMPL